VTIPSDVAAAVTEAHRREWGFVLASTVRVARDFDLAEDCVQEAFTQALGSWAKTGIPDNPAAWLTLVARRRALDRVRRDLTFEKTIPLLVDDQHADPVDQTGADPVSDDRLRLIFICCHPALCVEARVALTLRLLCGLSTREIARAFLVSEQTMAARITRAKQKISQARVPYRLPDDADLSDRVDAVLTVLHLLYTAGHTSPTGTELVRADLVERAMDLTRTLRLLLPTDPDVAGLHALMLLTDARRATRIDDGGRFLRLQDQDRSQWNKRAIAEGAALVRRALRTTGSPGRFLLMAAIAAVHAQAPAFDATDWHEIAGLYEHLMTTWPSPVVALNRAIAVGFADGPQAGLDLLDELAGERKLADYHYLPAARAEFLARLGRVSEAAMAYKEAIQLADNTIEADYLADQLHRLQP
jgi:RNA polymerase sigma factor (sigma-70 family)